jgi:hypothetical protein
MKPKNPHHLRRQVPRVDCEVLKKFIEQHRCLVCKLAHLVDLNQLVLVVWNHAQWQHVVLIAQHAAAKAIDVSPDLVEHRFESLHFGVIEF